MRANNASHPLSALRRRVTASIACIALIAGAASTAAAQTAGQVPVPPTAEGPSATSQGDVLKVCASTKEAPYSTRAEDGFENRIAEVLAAKMGRTLEYEWIERPAIYVVRDGLSKKTCDVVIGVDAGDERLATSRPYYRTAYAFVSRTDEKFAGSRWQDVGGEGLARFATRLYSPAETMLKYSGKYEDNLAYLYGLVNFKSRRNQYIDVAPDRLVQEVRDKSADLAIAFAPDVARYVKEAGGDLTITLITNDVERSDGETVELQYSQAVGVRKGDEALLAEIDEALGKARGEIGAILDEEGIPTLPIEDQTN